MPHYFFHLAFGTRTVLDEEGIELPDRSAARAEAGRDQRAIRRADRRQFAALGGLVLAVGG